MVDTCVLLDLVTVDPQWFDWSARAVAHAAEQGRLIINPIIYAELSVSFTDIEAMEEILEPMFFDYRPIPREAAFLTGKVFANYRRRGGSKLMPLPDFFIGAHACVESLSLLTRDPQRFRTNFPKLKLICPA